MIVTKDDSTAPENEIGNFTLMIGLPTGGKFSISMTVTEATTVLSVKEHLSKLEVTHYCPVLSQRLMHKGRILDNEQTFDECGIEINSTLFLVKLSASAVSAAAPTTPGVPVSEVPDLAAAIDENDDDFGIPIMPEVDDDDGIPIVPPHMMFPGQGPSFESYNDYGAFGGGGFDPASLLSNPAILGMMENVVSNNPDMVRGLIQQQLESNPAVQEMIESNPAVGQMLSDPGHIDEMMRMMQNPEAMQQAMRSQDLALSQIENMPGGFAALSNMYETMQRPLEEGFAQSNANETNEVTTNSTESAIDGATGVAMPNPWSSEGNVSNNRALPAVDMANNPLASLMSGGSSTDAMASLLGSSGSGAPGSNAPNQISSLLSSFTGGGGAAGLQGMPPNTSSMISQMMNPESMSRVMQMGEQFRGMQTNNMSAATGVNPWQGMSENSATGNAAPPTTPGGPDVNALLQGLAPHLRSASLPSMPNPAPQTRTTSGNGQPGLDFANLLSGLAPHLRNGAGSSDTGTAGNSNAGSRPVTLNISNLLQGLAPHLRESMANIAANQSVNSSSGSGASSSVVDVSSSMSAAERYRVQLKALNGMGFDNEEQNITALNATKGVLNSAVDMLLAGEVPEPAEGEEKKTGDTS